MEGTAVKGELLHHCNDYNPARAYMSMRNIAARLNAQFHGSAWRNEI
jgi:hypothetical protein